MAVPTRKESIELLCSFRPPRRFLAHSIAVAEVAAFLAQHLDAAGLHVDRAVVEAAALLHDIDKLFDKDDPLRALGHGDAGARWLELHGFTELSRPVAAHPITRLSDPERYAAWAAFSDRESRLVLYADKRAGQRVVSLAARLDGMERRHPKYVASLRVARARAERLERQVCDAARIEPHEVRRLPWVTVTARDRARSAPGAEPSAAPVSGG